MSVLTILGLVVASIVTATTGVVVSSRSSAQSRAAADAGIADLASSAQRGTNICRALPWPGQLKSGATLISEYSVKVECGVPHAGKLTMTSTGTASGVSTITRAEYNYSAGSSGHGADMVFFSDTTFTAEVLTGMASGNLMSIVIPSGGFDCHVHTPANVITSGDVKTRSACVIDGSVRAGGSVEMTATANVIKGSVKASATSPYNIQGRILGDIELGGPVGFGWNGFTYPGNVAVRGDINLASASIGGTLKIPAANRISYDGWVNIASPTTASARIAGGISWQPVDVPVASTFDPWFDYTYALSDWYPYGGAYFAVKTLAPSGNGPWTCNRFMANNPSTSQAAGWREVGDLTSPTIVDARACGALSTNNGSTPNVALRADVLFLAKSVNLTTVTFSSATATRQNVWFVVEDGAPTGSGKNVPSCTNGAGSIELNSADMSAVNAMVYTPCTIAVQGNSKWHGAFYGGAFSYGGGMTFVGDAIALPGMPASATMPGAGAPSTFSLGALVSLGDTN
ncbi:hypothetical protein FVP74_13825 [Microbacterium saccharophilum]|uniref:Uncharacterized protein n=1 Tax=Microbacterium saccharophilum TaxID=1213358 RepID=A0A5C8HSC5_9MICO|nr:hypothetical protein [Microbacterium saccharophilum]TXK08765.1 hypothetical protein FVP74_13825 [Microbacterium saccharophilum]